MSNFKIFSAFCVLICFTGCVSIKPGGVKSGKKLVETFYVGEEGSQFFIKPLAFYNIQSKEEKIIIDFTFRYKNEVKDSVIANFSLQSSTIFKSIDSLSLSNISNKIISLDIRLMFNETRKGLFDSRFTTKFSLLEFKEMFKNNDWTIKVYQENDCNTYVSQKKTKKTIKIIQDNVFILM
ncbi:MAG: hypothetical protein PHP52_05555 [Bacteroidales bacterium]|nr:hypothetical protein [Bacteroidales bacterium]MDD4216860.1 hypothetical protein [Bacteroidales bacterium]MDY0143032.1 hypothetical protein [Bacteroidales bacterium]